MHLVRAAQTEKNLNTNLFDEFWLLYPRKEGKKECRLVWDRIPESEHIAILEAVVAWRAAWLAEGRSTHYIKMPREWLILERWNDEVPPELVPNKHASHQPASGPVISSSGEGRSIPVHVQAVIDRLKAQRK